MIKATSTAEKKINFLVHAKFLTLRKLSVFATFTGPVHHMSNYTGHKQNMATKLQFAVGTRSI